MAPEPDRDEAEEDSSQEQRLLGLINQELQEILEFGENTGAVPEIPLQAPPDNNHNLFVNSLGPRAPREFVGLPRLHVSEPGFIDPRLLDVFDFETAPIPPPPQEVFQSPARHVPEPENVHSSPKHTSDQVPNTASNPGSRLIVTTIESGGFAPASSRLSTRARPQGLARRNVSGIARTIKSTKPRALILSSQRRRKCLGCRVNKKKCSHQREPIAELTREFINKHNMLFVDLGDLKLLFHALYEKITAMDYFTQSYVRPHNGLVSLYMVLGGPKSLAGPSDEHIVLFDPRRLQNMLQTDTEVYLAAMHPAIDVDSFDDFISRKMWSDHEQKPDSRITTAQRNILGTMRLFCGYFTLLSKLDEIKIYIEDTQLPIARLVCIALVYIWIHRLCHLYRDLGHNLQGLVDKVESNHYFAARILEAIYRCLCPLKWATGHPILQELNNIRCLLNRRVDILRTEISGIETDFAPPFRGDKRLKNHPTLKLANKFKMPERLYIYLEGRSARPSTNMLRTGNGSYRSNMYSLLDLLSSIDISTIPSDQPFRTPHQPDQPSSNPYLPFGSDGTLTTQALQTLESHAHVTHLQPQSTHTNAATRPSTDTDADPVDDLCLSDLVTWDLRPT